MYFTVVLIVFYAFPRHGKIIVVPFHLGVLHHHQPHALHQTGVHDDDGRSLEWLLSFPRTATTRFPQ